MMRAIEDVVLHVSLWHQLFETHKEEEEKKRKWHEVTKVTISIVVVCLCEIMWIITKGVEEKKEETKLHWWFIFLSAHSTGVSFWNKALFFWLTEMTDQGVKTTGKQYKRIFNYGLSMLQCCCCCCVCVILLDMKILGRQIDDEYIEEEDGFSLQMVVCLELVVVLCWTWYTTWKY